MDTLRACWDRVWRSVALGGASGDVYEALVEKYTEPHRAYHNLDHIGDCLHLLESVRGLLTQPAETELAIWFHDAIYDTRQPDNEARSAEWAETVLHQNGAPVETARRIGHLIRLTTHQNPQLIGDGAVLCDIDLAILGAEKPRFDAYDAAIRLEYNWVPEDVFRRERGRVLAGFLALPRIYHSQFFYEQLEQRARANLWRVMPRYLT